VLTKLYKKPADRYSRELAKSRLAEENEASAANSNVNDETASLVLDETASSTPAVQAPDTPPVPTFNRQAKLLSHLDRIVEWRETGITAPVMVVLDPTFKCNHRCPGCHGLMGQAYDTIPIERIRTLVQELAEVGVRSMPLGGGGDPSCHPDLAEILQITHDAGIETGFYTNGELLKQPVIDTIANTCEWIRISLDADGPEIHQRVHGASKNAFDKVVRNMERIQAARKKSGKKMVFGAGYLVRPDTMSGMYGAAKLCRDIGLDYLRIRPFFGYDNKPLCNEQEADAIVQELERCSTLETDSFSVNSPAHRMDWLATGDTKVQGVKCNIHHFTTHIGGDLKVYLCCHTVGWEKYCLGDLSEQSFSEIWYSDRRREIFENINYRDCATPCSMAAFNQVLSLFDSPVEHNNFL